jgi:cell division protein FtsW (lipid II flippase)
VHGKGQTARLARVPSVQADAVQKPSRPVTYVQRSRFLVAASGVIVLAHCVDVWASGGPNWAALGLRLAWSALLLVEAQVLARASATVLRATTVAVAMGTPVLYTALMAVTGRSESPLFPFAYVLAMAAAITLFDLFAVGLITAALVVVGAWLMLLLDGASTRAVLSWVHIGVVALLMSYVLATAFRVTQRANERLIGDLREALTNVKTLKGLLPVCAWCHRIRNDAGYWERLEAYVSAHSDAEFSHGMCPQCFTKHYGDSPTPTPTPQPPLGKATPE